MIAYIFAFLLSLGQIGRISFFNQEVNVYLYDFVLCGWLVVLMVKHRFEPIRLSFRSLPVLYLFMGWLGFTFALSTIRFSVFNNEVAFLYLLRLISYLLFFIYLSYHLRITESFTKLYVRSLKTFIGLTGLFFILQYSLYSNLRNLKYLGWDPHQYRVFGTFFDTSASGAIIGLILIFLYSRKKLFPNKRVYLSVFVIFILLGLLTYSRALYVSIFLTASYVLIRKKNYLGTAGIIVFFLIALILLPKPFGEGVNLLRTASIQSRIVNDEDAVTLAKKNYLFGVGYNHLRYARNPNIQNPDEPAGHSSASFHSSFLIVLTTAGIPGVALFAILLIFLGKISPTTSYYVMFLSMFSLLDNILLYPAVLLFFILLLGCESGRKGVFIFRTLR